MSSTQMRHLNTGANGLHPCLCKCPECKCAVILLSTPTSRNSNLARDHYHFDKSQSSGYWQYQATIATPTPKDKVLRAPHYHDPSCNRLTQKYHMPSKHLVPQPDVSKHGTLVSVNQQNFCLQGRVNSPERRQRQYKSRLQKVHSDAGPCKPWGKDIQERRTQALPGQGTAAAAASPGAVHAPPPGAPLMRSIPLPNRQEYDEYVLYGYGQGLAPGYLMGTVHGDKVDNVPKVPGRLDMALPVPFI